MSSPIRSYRRLKGSVGKEASVLGAHVPVALWRQLGEPQPGDDDEPGISGVGAVGDGDEEQAHADGHDGR
jgi:hypothetical protein